MRITTSQDTVLKKSEFEKKLGAKIDKWFFPEDENYLKIVSGNKLIYLRCEDIRELFNLSFNIFDEDIKVEKDTIVLKNCGEELYKGKAKHLSKIFKK